MAVTATIIKVVVAIAVASVSAEAFAVTAVSVASKTETQQSAVTASIVERAEADVQIRRIKNMIANNTVDGDEAFDRLEALHMKMRGTNK